MCPAHVNEIRGASSCSSPVALVQPVIWLLLFGELFQRVKQYLVPGVLVMTAFFSSGTRAFRAYQAQG